MHELVTYTWLTILFAITNTAAGAAQPTVPIAIPSVDARPALRTPVAASADSGHDWNGWYVGGRVGYTGGNASAILIDPDPVHSSRAFDRLDGGLQFGFNAMLASRLLLGAEADISFPDFLEDGVVSLMTTARGGTVTQKIDFVSTLRGRLGYARDRWLIYGTAGFAPSQARFIERPGLIGDLVKVQRWRTGWALGAGAEFAVARDVNASVEYLYDQFEQAGVVFPSGTAVESKGHVHGLLRLGLNRRLRWPGADPPPHETGGPAATETDRWNIHGQNTFIEQGYSSFRSPYEGTNSLTGASQAKNTESATAFLGLRLWRGIEMYFDPEIDQGFGLNTTHGVAAFPNGEAQKASFPMPRLVVDRLFLRQTFGLGGAHETVKDGPNQLAGTRDISRITLVVGRVSVADYFNGNAYANDPRTNFLNWNMYGAGAYDWTMDQLTWTWGALAELNRKEWAFRVGYFLLPVVSSTNSFDTRIPERGEYAAELEWRYRLNARPGTLRLFGWVNHGTMGGYADAVALAMRTPNYPDITLTRRVRTNPGFVINAEQAITDDLGLFSRTSWSPGLVEILGGTDCNRSLSLGGVLKGTSWGRSNDNVGVSGVVGGLSRVARAYFAAGGLGILIGDGQLNYREEKVLEAYYAYAPTKWATISFDYQFIAHPGYNADRGPVPVYAVRVHTEF